VFYFCPVISSPVLLYFFPSCYTLSCPFISYLVLLYLLLSCSIHFCPAIFFCPVITTPVLLYPPLCCYILSCAVISSPVLLYPLLSFISSFVILFLVLCSLAKHAKLLQFLFLKIEICLLSLSWTWCWFLANYSFLMLDYAFPVRLLVGFGSCWLYACRRRSLVASILQ
jgi:hypothetical protein